MIFSKEIAELENIEGEEVITFIWVSKADKADSATNKQRPD